MFLLKKSLIHEISIDYYLDSKEKYCEKPVISIVDVPSHALYLWYITQTVAIVRQLFQLFSVNFATGFANCLVILVHVCLYEKLICCLSLIVCDERFVM
jgi:hypothetical protein